MGLSNLKGCLCRRLLRTEFRGMKLKVNFENEISNKPCNCLYVNGGKKWGKLLDITMNDDFLLFEYENSNFRSKNSWIFISVTRLIISHEYIYIYTRFKSVLPTCIRAFIAHLWAHLSSVYKRDLLESLVPLMKMMESFFFSFSSFSLLIYLPNTRKI